MILRRRSAGADPFLASASVSGLLLVTGTSLFMLVFILQQAMPAITSFTGLTDLIYHEPWAPLASPPSFGILHAWVSTLLMAGICLTVAIPVGIGMGIFAAEVAPPKLGHLVQLCLETMAGVLAVVFGFVGFVTIVPAIEYAFGLAAGETLLAAGLVLGVMVLPFVASMTSESLRNIPHEFRKAGHSLGVTQWYLIARILLPKAAPGIFAGITLGFARAVGETLAVTMLAGNVVAVPTNLLDRGQPITALIATEIGEAGVGSDMYHALFASGLLLMVAVFLINIAVWRFRSKITHDVQ